MREELAEANEQLDELIKKVKNIEVMSVKFEDFATEEDKRIAREALEWDISDEELFEHPSEVQMDAARANEIIEANTTSDIKCINVSNELKY